jgi:hypothetical protein
MSNQETIGVIRTSYTESVTFTTKPDDAMRARLKAAGYKLENGNWHRNQTDGKLATLEDVAQMTGR